MNMLANTDMYVGVAARHASFVKMFASVFAKVSVKVFVYVFVIMFEEVYDMQQEGCDMYII